MIESYGDGVYSIDSGYVRDQFDAVHLLVESGHIAIIDTATAAGVDRVIEGIGQLGLTTDAVDWILLTHVHLDHAGAAGQLMRICRNARLAVHPRGLPHMVNPEKLWAGTCEVYGEAEALRMYGLPIPVDQDRTLAVNDGDQIKLGDRIIDVLDTPGHARHHVVYFDRKSQSAFTGDTFGIAYRELDADSAPYQAHQAVGVQSGRSRHSPFIFPSSTPVQFDPDAAKTSIRRIVDLNPQAVYLTHYSQIADVKGSAEKLLRGLDRYVEIAKSHQDAGALRQARIQLDMGDFLAKEAAAIGVKLTKDELLHTLDIDLRLNAAGLVSWLDSLNRARPS